MSNVKVLLNKSEIFPWIETNCFHIRGWYEKSGKIYSGRELETNWKCATAEDFCEQIRSMNGNYSVIVQTERYLFAAVDRISSFPLYYTETENGLILSDHLQLIRTITHPKVDPEAKEELLACGYILKNRTIYHGVFQLQAGQLLTYDLSTHELAIKDYFLHVHKESSETDISKLCYELDKAATNSVKRMIDSINGRTIALFLSGGFDSKLVAVKLKELNYKNVICVSFGKLKNPDTAAAKVIAESLGFPWIQVEITRKTWRDFKESSFGKKFFHNVSAHSQRPYLQGLILHELIECGKLPPDCIGVTGNSGDVIEGEDVTHCFFPGQVYSIDDIGRAIAYIHFSLYGKTLMKKLKQRTDFTDYSRMCTGKNDLFSDSEAEEIVEFFNWRERQSKYVVNDARSYDVGVGIEWRLPLWDNEFVDFWLSVPYDLRYDRKLYYQYVKGEALPNANIVPLRRKMINAVKKAVNGKLDFLYYPKAIWDYFFSEISYFGFASFDEYLCILREMKGNRMPFFACIAHTILKELEEK